MKNNEIDLMIMPSTATIKATFSELNDLAKQIRDDVKSILDTLQVIYDTLSIFTKSSNITTGLGMMSPVAWSIPVTLKLATNAVSNYITKKTGISFVSWVDFIDTTLEQLGEYTNQLDKVAEISAKYNQTDSDSIDIDIQQISEDENLLKETKSKTKLWKPLIEQTARLSEVIDAILDAQKNIPKGTTQNKTSNDEVAEDMKKMVSAVTDKLSEKTKDNISIGQEQLTKWVFSSVYDLKDKAKELNNQTKHLSLSIPALENLIDLEIAQIQAHQNKMSLKEVEILSKRIAAIITIPQLKGELIRLKKDVESYQSILDKLETEYKNNQISEKVYQSLMVEYVSKLNSDIELLRKVEMQAKAWKTFGISLLDDGIMWLREELELVRVRKLVGELTIDELKQKSKSLNAEFDRLDEAKKIISAL